MLVSQTRIGEDGIAETAQDSAFLVGGVEQDAIEPAEGVIDGFGAVFCPGCRDVPMLLAATIHEEFVDGGDLVGVTAGVGNGAAYFWQA